MITSDRKAFCFYRLFTLPSLQNLDVSYNELEYIPNEIQNLRYCTDFPVLRRGGLFWSSRCCWGRPNQHRQWLDKLKSVVWKLWHFPHFISKMHCFSWIAWNVGSLITKAFLSLYVITEKTSTVQKGHRTLLRLNETILSYLWLQSPWDHVNFCTGCC